MDNQETSTCYHLIFPFYSSTLQAHVTEKSDTLAQNFIKQISKGLSYLHSNDIIHCDLSPSNILIDYLSGCMVICDFGCAHPNSNKLTDTNEEIGTRLIIITNRKQ
jgi:serine/threonine-protein kinase ULK4